MQFPWQVFSISLICKVKGYSKRITIHWYSKAISSTYWYQVQHSSWFSIKIASYDLEVYWITSSENLASHVFQFYFVSMLLMDLISSEMTHEIFHVSWIGWKLSWLCKIYSLTIGTIGGKCSWKTKELRNFDHLFWCLLGAEGQTIPYSLFLFGVEAV